MSDKKRLSKWDLFKIWSRYGFFHSNSVKSGDVRGRVWLYVYSLFAKKYYSDDEEAARDLLLRHNDAYDIEPQTGQLVNGIVARIEEDIALGEEVDVNLPDEVKENFKEPVSRFGEYFIQALVMPVLLAIGIGFSIDGSEWGAVFYIGATVIVGLLISWTAFSFGYQQGEKALKAFASDNIDNIVRILKVVALVMAGTLVPLFMEPGYFGPSIYNLQSVTDLLPILFPFVVVWTTWFFLYANKMKPGIIMIIFTVVCAVIVALGHGFIL